MLVCFQVLQMSVGGDGKGCNANGAYEYKWRDYKGMQLRITGIFTARIIKVNYSLAGLWNMWGKNMHGAQFSRLNEYKWGKLLRSRCS